MFSLWNKCCGQLSSFLHDILDRIRNTGRTARHALRALDAQVRQAEESLTDISAELRLMQHERQQASEVSERWGQIARTAADANDPHAATEAIQQQVQADELADSLDAALARLSPLVHQMKGRLSILRQRKFELQHTANVLDARSKLAELESRTVRTLGNVGEGQAIDFSMLERNVDRQEAKAIALVELASDARLTGARSLTTHRRDEQVARRLQMLGIATLGSSTAVHGTQPRREADHA